MMDTQMSDPIPTATHRIAMADGITVQVHEFLPEQVQSPVPVLLLHGLTRNSKDFMPLVPHLLAQGRRVLAMDVPQA
jgi:pimeloyl-ACP methyl ester carboxylesterase